MKPYPKYKPTNIDWIGEIPENWSTKSLKYVISINDETLSENQNEDFEINYVEISDVNSTAGIKNFSNLKFIEAPSRARRVVKKGDVIVSTVRTYLKAIAKVSENVENLIVSTGFAVLRSKHINSDFLGYFVLSNFFIDFTISNSFGVSYPAINSSEIGEIKAFIPPLPEQQAIASYLDQKTALIDELIAKKQRKIELLKENRTALINHAVTKGLDPTVKYKDSGIEWIGEIPEHWKLVKLNVLGNFSKGKGITKEDIKEEGFLAIRNGEIYTKYNRITSKINSKISIDLAENCVSVDTGAVLFTGDGETCEDIGKCLVYIGEGKLFVGGGINVFLPKMNIANPVYLSYVLNSQFVVFQKAREGKGEIVVHIYSKQLREISLGLPLLFEQQLIVKYLDIQTSIIDQNINLELQKIEKLKEYRQSLISIVVTGKICVLGD